MGAENREHAVAEMGAHKREHAEANMCPDREHNVTDLCDQNREHDVTDMRAWVFGCCSSGPIFPDSTSFDFLFKKKRNARTNMCIA